MLTISQLCDELRALKHKDLEDGVHIEIADTIQATPRFDAPWDPASDIAALQVKERWYNQLVEWLRLAHREVYEDYTQRVMAVNKIENAPMAIGPPPVVTTSARPEAIDKALLDRRRE